MKPGQRGFTLIELVIVIVILGIVAVMTSGFVGNSLKAYTDTARRDRLASGGRLAVERISRELRNAHPASVRVVGDCLEFLPLTGTGTYQDDGSKTYPGGTAAKALPLGGLSDSAFDAFRLTAVPTAGDLVIAGPGDPYATAGPRPVAAFAGFGAAALPAGVQRLTLSGVHRFVGHSPARRVYFSGGPVGFCVSGGDLSRHQGYGLGNPPTGVAGSLLAEHIQNTGPFTYSGATLTTNAIVQIDLQFMEEGEWVRLRHEVQIRNVP